MSAASWQRFPSARCIAAAMALAVALVAPGCKSGSSWTAKPSWWKFGSDDPAKLADAPPSSTDVAKPSATQKPYPTTTTPEGYVLENTQRAGATQQVAAAAAPAAPATPPAAVTYGSQPAPATPPAAEFAAARAAPPSQPSGLSSIAPQVGPYGAPPSSTPAVPEQSLPSGASSFTATAPPAAPPAAAAAFGAEGARVADARGADSWSQPAPPPAAVGNDRYGTGTGSRFATASFPQPSASEPLAPPPAAIDVPAAAVPATLPAAPPGSPPAAVPAAIPAAAPTGAPPIPTRRPEAGYYRPGGTSNYRPTRSLLAGDDTATPAAVTPAAFESPAGP